MTRRRVLGLFSAAVLAAAGCDGGDKRVPVYPVSGQVLYDGKPAAGVQVFFYPTSAPIIPQIPQNPRGVTGPDGRFTLTTYEPGDGAAEGGYQVVLIWPAESRDNPEATEDRLLNWYDIKHSRLTANVQTGPTAVPPFNLPAVKKPAGEIEGVPGRN